MDQRVAHYDEKMKKAYEFLVADLATVRAGRANPHVLDKLKVDYLFPFCSLACSWKYS